MFLGFCQLSEVTRLAVQANRPQAISRRSDRYVSAENDTLDLRSYSDGGDSVVRFK